MATSATSIDMVPICSYPICKHEGQIVLANLARMIQREIYEIDQLRAFFSPQLHRDLLKGG